MNPKKEHIATVATTAASGVGKRQIKGKELIISLNTHGFKTNNNKPFVGGRGVYKLISATYHSLAENKRQPEADNVASTFIKENGSFAYK